VTEQETDPLFLTVEEVLALHEDQLRLFGGSAGIRDRGILESAVVVIRRTGRTLRKSSREHDAVRDPPCSTGWSRSFGGTEKAVTRLWTA